jgi:hypothetical protein
MQYLVICVAIRTTHSGSITRLSVLVGQAEPANGDFIAAEMVKASHCRIPPQVRHELAVNEQPRADRRNYEEAQLRLRAGNA